MPYYQTISCQQAWQLIHSRYGCRILDVRDPAEFAEGHIRGAVNIPLHSVPHRASALFPGRRQPLLVYCGSGARSLPAAQVLSVMGYTRIYNLRDGLQHWPYELWQG
ncbi:MAG: rhodanese-like domain-containing protein [Lachnospiraceae bacterium]|jgi:phage shock protein E|nr:rhodanese-like domain-containing protein [Lachnospiraceae bacterium]